MSIQAVDEDALFEAHALLESFGNDATMVPSRLSRLANLVKTLDPRQEYPLSFPPSFVRTNHKSPLAHTISLLQDYFHGADIGNDAYIRDRLFEMVTDLLERHEDINQDIGWIVPQMLDPLLLSRGWNATINPAGACYAVGVGRTLAPVMPCVLSDVILVLDPSALVSSESWPKTGEPVWSALENVSPAYLKHFLEGALPLLSSQALDRKVVDTPEAGARHGPRL